MKAPSVKDGAFFELKLKKGSIFVRSTQLMQRMTEKNILLQYIIEGIQDKKGKNISIIHLKGLPGAVCEYFVVCEGNTPTQVSALADSIDKIVKQNIQEDPIRVHGQQRSEWVAMDYGNIIVHIFVPAMRSFYNIDNLWEDAITERIPSIG